MRSTVTLLRASLLGLSVAAGAALWSASSGIESLPESPRGSADGECRRGACGAEIEITRSLLLELRLAPGEFYGWPRPLVAVSGRFVYVAMPPYDGRSLSVHDLEHGAALGPPGGWLPADSRVSHLVPVVGGGLALRLVGGTLGVVSAGRVEQVWATSAARTIDAMAGPHRALSVMRIATPELFGYWWYEMDLRKGVLTPGAPRTVVRLDDTDLLAVRRIRGRTCGVQEPTGPSGEPSPLVVRCWDADHAPVVERKLGWPGRPAARSESIGVALDNHRVWVVRRRRAATVASGLPADEAPPLFDLLAYEIDSGRLLGGTPLEREPLLLADGGYLVMPREASGGRRVRVEALTLAAES